MKKKFELVKTIQLIIFFGITAVGLAIIFTNDELYQMVGNNASVRILCVLLWLTMALSFVFIFWDFTTHSSFKKDYRELDYAVYNDHIAGIANRYSCDAMIAKYMDHELPKTIGCVMLDISNIREINEQYGHIGGNAAIQDFSNILHLSSLGICFVGRNGGNKFMALFEECEEGKINTFLTRLNQKLESYNSQEGSAPIHYAIGSAFNKDEKVTQVTRLISLADRRLTGKNDAITGFSNRASCDDIINLYAEREMPETLACVMLDIANIRQINDRCGHQTGNRAIRAFDDGLRKAAHGRCFVGRNGGTKFLAVFEAGGDGQVEAFLDEVKQYTDAYNAENEASAIQYRAGTAMHAQDETQNIYQLVALSDRRMRGENG